MTSIEATRCAIYTRKSSDDREDAQLTSCERQREMCVAYAASQPGWTPLAQHYDDAGVSGATMNRPALDRLLADVRAGLIDRILVYKIDRLSRSLRDFLNLIDLLERHRVAFVSITQSFSTADSMGRLMLNVLLSFAQFEREMVGERTRDWKAGARARGLWTSGPPPYGYSLRGSKLFIREERAEVVRTIYRRLPTLGSYAAVAAEINEAGHRNRLGRVFDGRHIKEVATNRLYRGELTHAGGSLPGIHEPIVTEAAWTKAQHAVAMIDVARGHAAAIAGQARQRRRAGSAR